MTLGIMSGLGAFFLFVLISSIALSISPTSSRGESSHTSMYSVKTARIFEIAKHGLVHGVAHKNLLLMTYYVNQHAPLEIPVIIAVEVLKFFAAEILSQDSFAASF